MDNDQDDTIVILPKRLSTISKDVSLERMAQTYAELHHISVEDARIIVTEIDNRIKAQIESSMRAAVDAMIYPRGE